MLCIAGAHLSTSTDSLINHFRCRIRLANGDCSVIQVLPRELPRDAVDVCGFEAMRKRLDGQLAAALCVFAADLDPNRISTEVLCKFRNLLKPEQGTVLAIALSIY